MLGMRLELRQEIHDAECWRCGEPRPSDRECGTCALENARLGATGEASIARVDDEIERDRNARRKENKG